MHHGDVHPTSREKRNKQSASQYFLQLVLHASFLHIYLNQKVCLYSLPPLYRGFEEASLHAVSPLIRGFFRFLYLSRVRISRIICEFERLGIESAITLDG